MTKKYSNIKNSNCFTKQMLLETLALENRPKDIKAESKNQKSRSQKTKY